jgi:hypothetical protein
VPNVTDPTSDAADSEPTPDDKPAFTKEPQPDLPLGQRKKKAGWNKNRIAIWIIVGAFAIYLIVTGLVGVLTKAR